MQIGEDTRAVISGATKGVGRATARALAERGAAVGLTWSSAPVFPGEVRANLHAHERDARRTSPRAWWTGCSP